MTSRVTCDATFLCVCNCVTCADTLADPCVPPRLEIACNPHGTIHAVHMLVDTEVDEDLVKILVMSLDAIGNG